MFHLLKLPDIANAFYFTADVIQCFYYMWASWREILSQVVYRDNPFLTSTGDLVAVFARS